MLDEAGADGVAPPHPPHLDAFSASSSSSPLAKELSRELNRVPAPLTTFGAINITYAPHNGANNSYANHNGANNHNGVVNGAKISAPSGVIGVVGVPYSAISSTGSATIYDVDEDVDARVGVTKYGGGGRGGGAGKFSSTLNPLYHVNNGNVYSGFNGE